MIQKSLKVLFILAHLPALFLAVQFVRLIPIRKSTPAMVERSLKSDFMVLGLDSLSDDQLNVLLAVEDPAFYSHKGIDHKSPGAGRTTISQGLVKIFYFKKFKPGIAKVRQTLIARFVFDPLVSKDDQLSLFINYVYLGNDQGKEIRGFEEASNVYYNKHFHELNPNEYLALVAMLINPVRYGMKTHPENNAIRVQKIKRLLNGDCKPLDWKDSDFKGCE